MEDFSNINAVEVAKKKFGIKEKKCWPGSKINTLHQFNDTCFGIVNEFAENSGNSNEIRNSPAGQACTQGVMNQIYLNGLSPQVAYNAYSLPVLNYSKQLYKNAYKLTKNPEEALKLALKLATNPEEKEMCVMCHEALLATIKNPIKINNCIECKQPDHCNCDDNIKENFEDETKQSKGGCGCNGVAIAFWVILGVIALMLIIWSILLIWKRKKN